MNAQRIGAVLGGRYRLERLIGEGGMGAVYEARDPGGNRYAIKLLIEIAAAREESARFVREARLMATLSHPNVTRILDFGVDPNSSAPYLVMELLSGEDVDSLLQRMGQLSPTLAVRIVASAAAGVEAAYAVGVIHRDVKPANIFLHDRAPAPCPFSDRAPEPSRSAGTIPPGDRAPALMRRAYNIEATE